MSLAVCYRISQSVLPIFPILAADAGGLIKKLLYVSDSSRASRVIGECAVHRRCVPASNTHVHQGVWCAPEEEVFFGIVGGASSMESVVAQECGL